MLKENETYTYKEICKVLGLETKVGNAKIKQLNTLKEYYEYEKEGTKFHIIKIKSNKPIQYKDNRVSTLNHIEHILQTTLSDLDDNETYFVSNKDLLKLCYIINNNYYSLLSNPNENIPLVKQKFGFDESFDIYANETYGILKPSLMSALKSMQSKKEISIHKGYKLVKNGKIYDCCSELDDIGKELFKIQGDAMAELGINNDSELYGRKKYLQQKYYDLCNKKSKELLGIEKFYQCYAIILNTNKIKFDIETEKNELNQKIYDKVHTTKLLRDLTYNEIDQWFEVLNTKHGDEEYQMVDFIKIINSRKGEKDV